MVSENRSARGYDRLASFYQPLEMLLFGDSLQRSRIALLEELPKLDRALVLGDGTGRLLEQFCVSQPRCQITSVDHSSEMLRHQRRRVDRVNAGHRVEFIQQDVRTLHPPTGHYDAIVAAYVLDCFTAAELSEMLPRLLSGIRDAGLFYFVDFIHPDGRLRRHQAAAYQFLMHTFFRWTTGLPNRTLVDLDAELNRHRLQPVNTAIGLHPMTTCRCYRYCVATGNR